MKVIFLDFDGVIRTTRSRLAGNTTDGFDPIAGRLIGQIETLTNSAVVVSSSWRIGRSRSTITALLGQAAMPPELLHDDWATPELDGPRQSEIDLWLQRHAEVDCYAVIDDGIGFPSVAPHLVRTEMDEGFGFPHVLQLCQRLKFDARAWLDAETIKLSSAERRVFEKLKVT